MKKHIASLFFSGIFLYSNAQTFELGLRGGADSFWLLNQDKSNAWYTENSTISLSYNGGAHIAFDITDNVGIETNFMYAQLNQTYSGSYNVSGQLPDGSIYLKNQTYNSKITLTEMQIPFMVCLETNSGSFVELGAQYDIINGANYSGSFSNPSSNPNYSVANYFAKSNVSGVFGVGGKYSLNDYLFMFTDFRIAYGFNNIKGVDGSGQASAGNINTLNASINLGIFYLLAVTPEYKVGHKCKGAPKVRSGTHHPH
jgi:hypothetical protein